MGEAIQDTWTRPHPFHAHSVALSQLPWLSSLNIVYLGGKGIDRETGCLRSRGAHRR